MNVHIKDIIGNVRSQCMQNDLQSAETNLRKLWKDLCAQTCPFPIKIKSVNLLTGEPMTRLVPCGHCAHCKSRKQQEWVTRMDLHNTYCAKYSYFITLTYRGYSNFEDIPKPLLNAYWHKDDNNYLKVQEYSPCLCRYEHFQRFMKYLRKLHNGKIMFYECHEYGSTYGRPHFHAILWTDVPLLKEHVDKAWTVNTSTNRKCPSLISIGKIDFNDLNANGTNSKVKDKNCTFDSAKAFAYVSKYCSKSILNESDDKVSRFWLFYNDLKNCYNDVEINRNISFVFDKYIRSKSILLQSWFDNLLDYITEIEHAKHEELLHRTPALYYKLNLSHWELVPYDVAQYPFFVIIDNNLKRDEITSSFYSSAPFVLRKVFTAGTQCSRSEGIGFQYANNHIEEFAKGQPFLPQSDSTKYILPSAMVRYLKKQIVRYYKMRSDIFGKPISLTPFLLQDLHKDAISIHCHAYNDNICTTSIFNNDQINVNTLLRSNYAGYDAKLRMKFLVYDKVIDAPFFTFVSYVAYYKYDRSSKSYKYQFEHTLDELLVDSIKTFKDFERNYIDTLCRENKELSDFMFLKNETISLVDTFLNERFICFEHFINECYDSFKSDLKVLADSKHYHKLTPLKKQL